MHHGQRPGTCNRRPFPDRTIQASRFTQLFFIALGARSYSRCIASKIIHHFPPTSPHQLSLLPFPSISDILSWIRRRPPRSLWRTGLEPILELARNLLHGAHTTGPGRLSSLGFHAPVVCEIAC